MFLVKYYKEMALALLILTAGYLSIDKFNSYVDSKVQAKYDLKISEYNSLILEKVKTIESNSNRLVTLNEKDLLETGYKLEEILKAAKKKSLVTITKEGQCNPSTDFVGSFNHILEQGTKSAEK